MCGRYTLFKLDQFLADFPNLTIPGEFLKYFNIAPTTNVPAILNTEPVRLASMHLGLVPFWAKDPSVGNKMINARAETLAEKPAFKTALARRRCLVPADGFYEWKKESARHKTPMYIHLRSDKPFAFAGLWEQWHSPDGSMLPSLTIITTRPNALMADIHDRMPAIVRPADYPRWLESKEMKAVDLQDIFEPYPADLMEAYPVSSRVNRPGYDSPDCIQRAFKESLF